MPVDFGVRLNDASILIVWMTESLFARCSTSMDAYYTNTRPGSSRQKGCLPFQDSQHRKWHMMSIVNKMNIRTAVYVKHVNNSNTTHKFCVWSKPAKFMGHWLRRSRIKVIERCVASPSMLLFSCRHMIIWQSNWKPRIITFSWEICEFNTYTVFPLIEARFQIQAGSLIETGGLTAFVLIQAGGFY